MKELLLRIVLVISLFSLAYYGYYIKEFLGSIIGLLILILPLYVYVMSEKLRNTCKWFMNILFTEYDPQNRTHV